METTNERKFRELFEKELYNLQNFGNAAYQNIIKEEEHFFMAVSHGKKREAYHRIDNMFNILSVEEDDKERMEDYRRFFTFLSGAAAKHFSKQLSFSWEFLATATSLMKIVDTWKTEEEFREGKYFITDTFLHTIRDYYYEAPSHPQIMKFITYVEENIYGPLSTKIIAEELGVSAGHLSRLLKQHMDTNCTAYVKERKLEESIYLLQDIERPVHEVAETISISHGHFIRIFQERYQCSPSEYRKRLRFGRPVGR